MQKIQALTLLYTTMFASLSLSLLLWIQFAKPGKQNFVFSPVCHFLAPPQDQPPAPKASDPGSVTAQLQLRLLRALCSHQEELWDVHRDDPGKDKMVAPQAEVG